MIDKNISHYKILEKLGSGGMGDVYKAEDTKLKRIVALKFLPPELTRDEEARQRFVHEARAASALDHPNICNIYEIDETENGQMFIAMACYEGETLKDKIARGPLPIAEAIDTAIAIAQGLAKAHSKGIVHRDIKPANILITEDSQIKIVDFGLAKLAGITVLTKEGTTPGTVTYMSPEQTQGTHVDQRTDIWALGVVLYEILTGEHPFKGDHELAVIHSIISEDPEPIKNLNPSFPPELEQIVDRALQKKPESRYSSVLEMLKNLKACQDSLRAVETGAFDLRMFLRRIRRPRILVPAVGMLLLTILGAVWFFGRQAKIRWAREVALPEIERLTENLETPVEGLWCWQAYKLAKEVERYIPNDPTLEIQRSRFTNYVRIGSDPPGADIYIKPYAHADSTWNFLGQATGDSIRLPIALFRLRLEKPGYETIQDILWTKRIRSPDYQYPLTAKGEIPDGMVKATGSEELGDFLIDRYEVTNEAYKRFIDSGGYSKKEYWKHEFIREGKTISWHEALASFTDKTGLAGPATWEVGDFPAGHEDYPVAGLSWFEAAAYAEFAGKSLPTTKHWQYVAASSYQGVIVPVSNLNGISAAAVGSSGSMNRFGVYDLAGNVREWCLNTLAGSEDKFILGGGWTDPDYSYGDLFAQSPFDRSPTNGFRCVKYLPTSAKNIEDLTGPIARETRDLMNEKPVSEEEYRLFLRMYAYDKQPLNAKIVQEEKNSHGWIKQKVVLDAAYGGEQLIAYVFLPRGYKPPYQTVIYFPGGGAFQRASSKRLPNHSVYDFIPKSGRALIYPVYKGTYERRVVDDVWDLPPNSFRDVRIKQVKDFRRIVDYLETRDDFDSEKLCFFGFSAGGRMAPLVMAVEDRLKLGVIFIGGLELEESLPEVNPLNFVSRIKMPVLMLNGKYDYNFPLETSQRPLFELLGTPSEHKKWIVYENNGHYAPRTQRIKEILSWLDQYFGPVKQ